MVERDKCWKERIRYGKDLCSFCAFLVFDNLGFQIRIISLEESIGRSPCLFFGFPHDDDDDNDDATSCKILARVQAFVIPRTLREAVSLFIPLVFAMQPGTVFPLVIRIRDFRRQRTKEDGKGITERETFPENPITRHNFCDICIWIVPRLRKFAAPCFFFFSFLMFLLRSFIGRESKFLPDLVDTAFHANWRSRISCFEIFLRFLPCFISPNNQIFEHRIFFILRYIYIY